MPLKHFITSIVAMACTVTVFSQSAAPDSLGPFTIPGIDTWKIHSSTIGEDYTIYVLKNQGYDTSAGRNPVLYMTDGDWNMTVAMNCFSMLRQDYTTHEPLVVGIGYGKNENKRVRDLDPATGGPAFLTFIEKEVMPFIDKQYRTNDQRAIYGYSMGGMFTTYILFHRADLFQKIYIGAPGNNGRLLMPAAREYFSSHHDLRNEVFAGVGSFEKETAKNIDSFETFLRSKKIPGLRLHTEIAPDANHGAALAQVMQDAIAFGYCERHEPLPVGPAALTSFPGTYEYTENGKVVETVQFFVKNGKLFFAFASQTLPFELFSAGDGSLFVKEDEPRSFRLGKTKEGKTELVIGSPDGKEYHLPKK